MQSRESPGTTSKHLRKMGGLIKETETNFLNNTPITTYGNLNTKKTPWISGQRIKEFIVANQIKNAKFKGRFSITKYRSKDVVFTSNNKQYTDLVCINQEKQYPLKEQQQTSLNDNNTSIQIDNNNRNQFINNVHSNPPETSPSFFNQTVIHKKGKLSTYILKPNETRNKKTIHPSKSVGVFVSLKGTNNNNNTSYTNEKEDIQTTFDMNSINSNSNTNTYMQNRIQNKNDYVIQVPRTRQQQSRSRSRSKGHNNNDNNNNTNTNNNNNDNSRYSSNSNGKGSFYEITTSPIHMNSNNNNNISQNDSCDNNILFNKAPSTNHDYEKYTSPSQKRTNNTYYSQYSRTPMYSYSGNKSHENEENKNMRKYKPYSGGKIDFIRPIDVYDNIKKNHIDKVIFIQRFMKAKLNKNGNYNDNSSNNNSICRSGIDDAIITSKGDLLTSLLNKYVKNVVDSKRVMKYVFERIKNKSGINNNHSKNSINKQRKGIKRKASPIVTNFKYCPDEHVNTINEMTKQTLTNKPNTLLQTQQTPQFTDMSIGYNVTNIQLNSSNTNNNKEQNQQQQQHEQPLPLYNNNNTLPTTPLNPNDNTKFKSKPPLLHNEQQQHHSNQQPLLLISQEHSFTISTPISTIPKPKPSLSITNTYSNQIILSKPSSLSSSHSNHNTNKQHKPYSTTKENNLLFKSIDPSKRFKKEFNRIIRVSYGDEFMLPSKPTNKQEQSYITRTTTTGSTCTSGRDSNRKGTQIQTPIIPKKIITETNIEILPKAHKPKQDTFVIMNENVFDINSYHKSFNVNEMKTQQNVIEFNNEHKPKKQNEIQRLNDMMFEIHVPSSSMHKGFHKEKIEISKGDDMVMCYKNKLFDFGNIVVDKGNEFTECNNNGNNSSNKDKCELICSSDIKYEIVRQSKVNDNTFEIINSETIMMSSKYKHFDVSGIVVEQNECFTNNNNIEHITTSNKDKQCEITLNDQLEFISNNEKKDDITKQDKEILYEITNSYMFNVESKNKTFNTNAFVIEQNEQFTDEHIKQEIVFQIQTLPHSQVNIISPIIPLNDNITQTELLLLSSVNEITSCDSFIMINNHKQFNTNEIVIEHNEAFTEENIQPIIKQYTTHFENEFEMLAYNLTVQQQEQTTQTEISPPQRTHYHIINNTPPFTITTHNKHFNTNAFTIEQSETFTQQFPINNAHTHTSSPLLISQSLPITLISRNKSFPLTSLHITDNNVLSSSIFPKAKPPLSITPLIPLTYTSHIPSLFNHSSLSTSQSSFSIKHQYQDEQQQAPSSSLYSIIGDTSKQKPIQSPSPTTSTVTNTVIPPLQPLHFSTNKLNPYSNHSLSIISPRTNTSQVDSPYKHTAFTVSTENLFQYTNNISSQKKFITLTQSNQETDIVFPRSKESNYSCSVLSPSRQRDSLIKESFDFEFGTLIDNSNRNSSNTTNTKTVTDLETTHSSSFELLNDPKQYVTTKAKNFKRGNVENISFILKSKIKSPFWNENLRVDSLQSPLILNETLAFTPIIDSRSLKQYVVSPQHEMNVHYCTIKEICEDDINNTNNGSKYKKQFKYKQQQHNKQCSDINEEYVKEEFAFSFMPKQCDVSINQVKTMNNVFTVSEPNSISVSFVPVPKQVMFTENKLTPIEHIELSINANNIDLEQHSQQQQQQQQLIFANNNNNTNEPHVVIRTLETLEQDDLFNNSSNVPDSQVDNNNNTSKSNNTNNNALNMILTTPHESPQINTLPITHNFTHLEITSSPSNILFIPPTYSPTTSSSQLKQLPPNIQSPLNTLPKTNLKPLATTSHPPSSHNSNSNLRSERMNSEECSYNDLSSGNRMLNRAFNKYFYDYIKSSNNNNNSINLDNINPNTNSNNINTTNTNNNNNNYFNIESARSPWGILNDHNISVVSMDNYLNQNTFDFAYENFQFISPSTQLKDNPVITTTTTTTTNNKQMEDKQTSTDLPEIIITHLNDKQIITDDALVNYDKGDIDNDCENEGDGGAMLKRSGSVINEKAPIRRKLLNRKLKKKDSRGNSGELSASSANSNNNMNYQFTSVLQNNKGELKKPRSQNNLLQFRNRTLDINNSLSYSKAEAKSEDSTPKSTSNQATNFIMEANHIEMLSKPMQGDNNIESENKCVQTEPHLFSYCVSKVNDDIQINGVQSNTTTTTNRSSGQFQSNQIQKAFLPILLTRIWNTHLKRYGICTLSSLHNNSNNNNNVTTKPSYIPIQSTTFSISTSKPLSPPHIIISNENTLTFYKTPSFPQLKHKLTRIINVLYKTKPLHKRFTKWNLNATILNISTHLLKLKMNNINKEHQITFTYDYSNSYLHYKKPHDDINKDYRKQPSKTNSVVEFDEPFDTFRGACSCSEKITPKSDKSQMSSESSIKKLNSITQSQTLQIPYQHVNENNILKKTYFYYYSDIIKLAMCMNKWNKKSKTISNLHKRRIQKINNVYTNNVNKQCYNLLKKCIMKWKIKKIIIKPPSFKHHPHKSSVNKSEVNKHNIITLNNSNSIISNNNSNLNSNRTNNKKDSFSSDYSPIFTSKPLDNTNNTNTGANNNNTNTNNDSSPVKTIRVKKVPRSKKTMSKTVGSFIHPSTDDKWELKMTQHNSPTNTKYKGMKVIHRYIDVTSKDNNNNNNTKNDNNKFIGGSISNYNNLQQNQINMIIKLNNIFIKSCLVISFNKWKYIKMRTQIGMIIDTQTKCSSKTLNLFLILLYLYTHNMYVETPRGLDKKLLAKVKVMFIWYRKVLLHKKKLNI